MDEEKRVDGQGRPRRSGANGLAVLATVALLTFAAFVSWFLLKVLAFASPALVPVLLGFFLALFFRPYYHWWRRLVHNPTLALVVMCATIFVPVGFAVWYAGAVAGVVYGLVARRFGLSAAIVSHAVTNFALGLLVIFADHWEFW